WYGPDYYATFVRAGASQRIRADPIHHSILPRLTRKSGCIAADRFSVTPITVRATSSARAAKARSTPERILSVFAARKTRTRRPRTGRTKVQYRTRRLTVNVGVL